MKPWSKWNFLLVDFLANIYISFQSSLLQYSSRSVFFCWFKIRRNGRWNSFRNTIAFLSHVYHTDSKISGWFGWKTHDWNLFKCCFNFCCHGMYGKKSLLYFKKQQNSILCCYFFSFFFCVATFFAFNNFFQTVFSILGDGRYRKFGDNAFGEVFAHARWSLQ